jgi:polar amino acid transport system substrate-binding protein
MKRLSVVMIVLFLVFGFSTGAFADQGLDRIKSSGVLKVGSTATGIPTTFMDKQSGKIVGIMVDVSEEVAKYLGVKLEVVETAWSSLIPSLQTQKIDMLAAAMIITPQRQEVVDFSVPVYPYCEALVVKDSDTKPYASLDELTGLKLGAQVGTFYIKSLEERGFKNVAVYDNAGDILTEISNGRIDGGVIDGPIAKWLAKNNPQFKIRVVNTYKPVLCGDIGIGVNKENKDLLQQVNAAVEKMKKEGKVEQILQKWGQ